MKGFLAGYVENIVDILDRKYVKSLFMTNQGGYGYTP